MKVSRLGNFLFHTFFKRKTQFHLSALISSNYEPYHALNSNKNNRPVGSFMETNKGHLFQQGRHVSFPSPAVPPRSYRMSQIVTTNESYLNPRSVTPVGTDF